MAAASGLDFHAFRLAIFRRKAFSAPSLYD